LEHDKTHNPVLNIVGWVAFAAVVLATLLGGFFPSAKITIQLGSIGVAVLMAIFSGIIRKVQPTAWSLGFKRWIILALVTTGIYASGVFPPVQPHIQVAPEVISREPLFTLPVIGDFYLTNTIVAMLIGDVILILIALSVRNALKKGTLTPTGLPGFIEFLFGFLYDMTESTAGKWTKKIFPFFLSITLIVLIANWLEMFPGVDSIGLLEPSDHGYPLINILPGLAGIVKGEAAQGEGYLVVPYVRVLSTDLNFTAALALISIIFTQVIGVQAQGFSYFSKFFNTTTFFKKPLFGAIDWAVSVLELISEFSKIISFTFRLFGNVFAGMVLLFLIGTLIPVFAQSAILLFEFFIGLIQAFVFGMLTMVFMSMATMGHGGEENEHSA
jgi:F-type H+-transporting ATPase subunit a